MHKYSKAIGFGGDISGYSATGSLNMQTRPARTKNSEMTIANLGRLIKKAANMIHSLSALHLLGCFQLSQFVPSQGDRLGEVRRLAQSGILRHQYQQAEFCDQWLEGSSFL